MIPTQTIIVNAFGQNEGYIYVKKWGSEGTGEGEFRLIHGIDFDSSGYVYIADSNNGRIQKFDSNGKFVSYVLENELKHPHGIIFDSSDNLYVTDANLGKIIKFYNNGKDLRIWGGGVGNGDGELDGVHGIAIDSSGNLYVADTNNHRVQKFDSNGKFIKKWGSEGADSRSV